MNPMPKTVRAQDCPIILAQPPVRINTTPTKSTTMDIGLNLRIRKGKGIKKARIEIQAAFKSNIL